MSPARFLLFMLAAALFPRLASASASYAWIPDDPSGCCRGVLELSDTAYLSGGAKWTPGFPADMHPVERFQFEGRFKVGEMHPVSTSDSKDVDLAVTFAATPDTARCCAWDFDLRVDGNGLKGRLRVTTQNDDVILSGTENGWKIERAGSDAVTSGTICGAGANVACLTGNGRWVLISDPGGLKKVGAHGPESPPKDTSLPLR